MENYEKLVLSLTQLPSETPWLEFKHNNHEPDMIGKDISALANSAILHERDCAYMIWGVNDDTHEIVGTRFDLQSRKKGNQELDSWLRTKLSKNADYEFHKININDNQVGLLIVQKAANHPVTFDKVEYIRVGSYTKKLIDYPRIQAQLWDRIRYHQIEEQLTKTDLDISEALGLLDYAIYFDLQGIQQPSDNMGVAHYLSEDGIITKQDSGLYSITVMGAVLFAKNINDFPRISRKAVRIVQYDGLHRMNMTRQEIHDTGYVVGFESLVKYIEALTPSRERIVGALREKQSTYPTIAIREVVASALIHQDFSISGAGPVVEVFQNRIEITNPGTPLVDINRIIDNPPKSRNEKLAALMRRLRICEELGTGWDKIVFNTELFMLPAPRIFSYDDSMKVILFAEIPFSDISKEERIWACYLHACIKQVHGEQLTNSSLRERFGLKDNAAGNISRLIKDSIEAGYIKPSDPETAPRYMKYIPIWA